MSEQLQPGETLVDQTPATNAAVDGDPLALEGKDKQAGELGTEDDDGVDEDTAGEKKQSRFQRFKQEQEQLVLEKDRELRYWRDIATKQSVEPAPKVDVDAEPVLDDFDGQGLDAYLRAHQQWSAKMLMAQARQATQEAVAQERQNAKLQAQVIEARKEFSDWDEVIARNDVSALQDTAELIISGSRGYRLVYHLATNPKEHARLNSLSSVRRLAELGKLEDKLSGAHVVVPPKVTKAPGPLTTVNGASIVSTDTALAARQGYGAWKAANAAKHAKK